jgi:hypothetical protein
MVANPNPETTQTLPKALTLVNCLQAVEAAPKLKPAIRKRLASSLRTAAKILGHMEGSAYPKRLDLIVADPDQLRVLLKAAPCGAVHVSRRHLGNVISDVRRACDMAGPRSKRRVQIADAWIDLFGRLPDGLHWNGLRPILRSLSVDGKPPAELTEPAVCAALVEAFAEHSEIEARKRRNKTARLWNAAIAAMPDWPNIPLKPERRIRWSPMKWEELPDEIRGRLDQYYEARVNRDLRSSRRSRKLSKSSAKKCREYVRHLVTAMRDAGIDISQAGLNDLVNPNHVDRAIGQTAARLDKERCSLMSNMVVTAMAIARDFGLLEHGSQAMLQTINGNVRCEETGITEKNQRQIDQFNDPSLRGRLLMLPSELMTEARLAKGTIGGARKAENALTIQIGLRHQLRGENIAMLRHDMHVSRHALGVSLRFKPIEMKNNRKLKKDLTPDTIRILDEYMRDHHPVLAPNGSQFVFPNEDDPRKQRPTVSLMESAATQIRSRLMVEFHCHLFRHLASKLIELVAPEDGHILGDIVGHAPGSSATARYSSRNTANAERRMQEIFEDDLGRARMRHRGVRKPTPAPDPY